METILTNQNLIDGLARSGHLSMFKKLDAQNLSGEITWQGLELLAPLAQLAGQTGTKISGTLHATKAYQDTLDLLSYTWPDLTITTDYTLIRDAAWDPIVRERVTRDWLGTYVNETSQSADGLILMEGETRRQRVDRTGENVTDVASYTLKNDDAGSITKLDLSDISGGTSLEFPEPYIPGKPETTKYVLNDLPGVTEIDLSGTELTEGTLDLRIFPDNILETISLTGSGTNIVIGQEGSEALKTVKLGSPETVTIINPRESLEGSGVTFESLENLESLEVSGISGSGIFTNISKVL